MFIIFESVLVSLYSLVVLIIGVINVKLLFKKIGIFFFVIRWKRSVLILVVNKVVEGLSLINKGISIVVLKVIKRNCIFIIFLCKGERWFEFI